MEETCEWWDEDGVWASSCGVAFQFDEGYPAENGFKFCYRCGKKIEVKPVVNEDDD